MVPCVFAKEYAISAKLGNLAGTLNRLAHAIQRGGVRFCNNRLSHSQTRFGTFLIVQVETSWPGSSTLIFFTVGILAWRSIILGQRLRC